MSFYNPATAYPTTNYATNPYSGNPYVSVPNPFANNPFMAQQPMQQPMNGQQDYSQGQGQQPQYPANQAPKQPAPQQVTSFFGKAVTGVEEAKQSNMVFDGSVNIFTDIGNGRIYTRQLMLDGTVATNTYTLQPQNTPVQAASVSQAISPAQPQAQAVQPSTAAQDMNAVVALMQDRINGLENTVNSYKEMFLNGIQPTTNRTNANGKSKPNADDTNGGGK